MVSDLVAQRLVRLGSWGTDHWDLGGADSSLFLVTLSAPEHFGDTILFTTDEDILEAIFCSDETFDVDVEGLCGPQCEEALRRPSTADGDGEERPYTQAGSGAADRVGLEGGGGGAPAEASPRSEQGSGREERRWMSFKLLVLLFDSPIFLLHFWFCTSYFIL